MATRYYLAGPMSGIPQFNFPAFDEAATNLRADGYDIISPAELDDEEIRVEALSSEDGSSQTDAHGKTWGDFLARDVKIVADEVDGIILLPGWINSKGARLECFCGLLQGHRFMLYYEGEILATVMPGFIRHSMNQVMRTEEINAL